MYLSRGLAYLSKSRGRPHQRGTNFFKKLLKIIAIILIIIAIVFFVYAAAAYLATAGTVSLTAGTMMGTLFGAIGLTGAVGWGTFLAYGLGLMAVAAIIDPATTKRTIERVTGAVSDIVGGVVDAGSTVIGKVVSGSSNVIGSFFTSVPGLLLLSGIGYVVYKKVNANQ